MTVGADDNNKLFNFTKAPTVKLVP
jgi:hypothetical protein